MTLFLLITVPGLLVILLDLTLSDAHGDRRPI
jgi:hypothetical protein